jgi:hypothetical protein
MVKDVLFHDPDPRQLAELACQLIALARELLFPGEQRASRFNPSFF